MFFREPVVDTNVLVDMAIPSRPRHSVARRLTSFFEREGIKPWVPAHGIFELHAAVVDEGLSEPQDPTVFPSDDHPFKCIW
jgi:predicted nucleic acid-binding protein